jgi:LmbE family N-acetylglucosaminyl deacetylase
MSRPSHVWVFRLLFVCLAVASFAAVPRPHFDPSRDYAYDLTAAAIWTKVELDPTGFGWPAGAGAAPKADTAFLEITLTETTGEAPEIRATRGGLAVRQVFEENARGRRFLDVSPLVQSTGDRVMLTGLGAAWNPGAVRLFLSANTRLTGRRVLVLAPHPDDAEIAAFGIYRRTGADVVTVTAGDAGGENFKSLFTEPAEHFRVKGWIRTWDSITVPFYGGIPPGQARNLGYYDGTLAQLQATPGVARPPLMAKLDDPAYYRRLNVDQALRDRPFAGTWEGLVADLVWELERVRPEIIVAPHPLLDAHPDHQYTTIALIDALARWPARCELYLYTNHGWENEAFPLGDRGAMTGLPAWSGGDLFFRGLCSLPLSPEEQKLKLIALEDMHDLRAFDLRDGTPPTSEAERRSWKNHDYYRRGPRPNELFFVVTREDAVRLRSAFLGAR